MLMNRDEGGELRPPQWELEDSSYDDVATMLAEGTITRGRAIKLAGAALLGGALTVLWADEADARNKKKRRRRRRRKARVTTPEPVPREADTPLPINLTVENPGSTPLTISEVRLLGADGTVLAPTLPVTIAPGAEATIPVTVTYDGDSPLVDAGELRLIDSRGVPVTVVDENGIVVGDVNLDFAA